LRKQSVHRIFVKKMAEMRHLPKFRQQSLDILLILRSELPIKSVNFTFFRAFWGGFISGGSQALVSPSATIFNNLSVTDGLFRDKPHVMESLTGSFTAEISLVSAPASVNRTKPNWGAMFVWPRGRPHIGGFCQIRVRSVRLRSDLQKG
jgi:hypothetical protein